MWSLLEKHKQLKTKYAKLQNKLKKLQSVQVWCCYFQIVRQCNENNFLNRRIIKMRTQLDTVSLFFKNWETEKEMEAEEFGVEMEEELIKELKEDVEDEVEDTD